MPVVWRHRGALQLRILHSRLQPRPRVEVVGPDRAQRRRLLSREFLGRLRPRPHHACVPELGSSPRGERRQPVFPAHAGRRRDHEPVGQFDCGFRIRGTCDGRGAGNLRRCRLRSDCGDRVDIQLERRPVEQSFDGERDARVRGHLEHEAAALCDPHTRRSRWSNRVDRDWRGLWRVRRRREVRLDLDDRGLEVRLFRDRLRSEVNQQESGLRGVVHHERSGVAAINSKVSRLDAQSQEVVRPRDLDRKRHRCLLRTRSAEYAVAV